MSKGYVSNVANFSQTEKARKDQVENNAGGYVFEVSKWDRLNRFLILGSEGGSYYVSEKSLTRENYDCITDCLNDDFKRTVDTIVEISDKGRAVKNTPAVFALAVCSVFGSQEARTYANRAVSKVARFSTDFFQWVDDVVTLKDGRKGKGLLRAIGRWYTEKELVSIAYQACKYPSRSLPNGHKWGHRDLLRLARIAKSDDGKTSRNGKSLTLPTDKYGDLFKYIIHGVTTAEDIANRVALEKVTGKKAESYGVSAEEFKSWKNDENLKYVWAHETAKTVSSNIELAYLIKDYKLTRESIPVKYRNDEIILRELVKDMPLTALIRNLGSLTANGVIKTLSMEEKMIVEKLTNQDVLKKARIHPMTLLMAKSVYEKGGGIRTAWKPSTAILEALEDAFYSAFEYVEPTGKNYLLGVDISGSMSWGACGSSEISAAQASAVVAMAIARSEKFCKIHGFARDFVDLGITRKDSLDTVMKKTSSHNFGSTNCAIPMTYAQENKLDIDVFIVLTDCETWCGNVHPYKALQNYRKAVNPNAKLVVAAFTSSGFTIADPNDKGMLDIVGLDSNIPKIISEFALDKI